MVVHIPPGGLDPTVISFPHALQVPRYGCKSAGPGQPRQAPDMSVRQPLNTSFGFGPACLWRTVEQVSGIRLDHFIELGLGGFVRAVNAVGGVTLFSPTAVNDPDTGLHLQPGYNHLGGVQALAFWRTGDGVGVSSDLLRIHRDQNLMVAFMRSVSQSDLAAHPASLLTVLSDLTSSMTVDSGLSEAEMLRIALDLKNAESQQVRFITVPNIPDPGNVGVDSLAQPAAGQLFSEIAHDRPPG
jgi:LCP family protein required for cell wall assembly